MKNNVSGQYVSQRTKHLLKERNMSMYELAARAKLPYSTIKNICSGASKNPTVITIGKIARAFDISMADFFKEFEG